MSTLFLLVLGILLMFNGMPVLGLISVVTMVLLGRTCEKIWCVVLGIVLLCSPWWPAGLLSIAVGILAADAEPYRSRPSMHNIRF